MPFVIALMYDYLTKLQSKEIEQDMTGRYNIILHEVQQSNNRLNNEKQLLNKIINLYKKPKNKSSKMHQYAVDNFSSKKICDSFTKLYREALN